MKYLEFQRTVRIKGRRPKGTASHWRNSGKAKSKAISPQSRDLRLCADGLSSRFYAWASLLPKLQTPITYSLFFFLFFPFVTLVTLVTLLRVHACCGRRHVFGQGNVWVKIHRILISRFKALLSAFLGSGGTTIHPRGENRFWGKLEGFLRVSVARATT